MTTEGRLETFDIVTHLATIGPAQTDYSACQATFNKSDVVKNVGSWSERDHAQLTVFKPGIDPNERRIPVELVSQRKRQAMLCLVGRIFRRIELDSHALL